MYTLEEIIEQNAYTCTVYETLLTLSEKVPMWFTDKRGRTVAIEDIRFGELIPLNAHDVIFINHETFPVPVWVKLKVNGVYLNDDGWYGWLGLTTAFGADIIAHMLEAFEIVLGGA